jgi:predicted DNA-binding protein
LAGFEDNLMENDAQFALRLPAEVIARLDALGARLRSQRPGLRLSRADVTRMLILDALGRMEHALAVQDDAQRSPAGDAIKSGASAELFDHKADSVAGATAVDTARARYAPKRATS